MIVKYLLALKTFINESKRNQRKLTLIPRSENTSAASTVNLANKHLAEIKIKLLNNTTLSGKNLSKHGLHLNNHGRVRNPSNYISYIKNYDDTIIAARVIFCLRFCLNKI